MKPNTPASNSMTSTKGLASGCTDQKSKPFTFLQFLSVSVNYCIGYKIQQCHIPPDLQISQETYFLHQEIITMQRKLKTSIREDYNIQRGKILTERKRVIDKK